MDVFKCVKEEKIMELHIKNMVCGRCIKTVSAIFEKIVGKPERVQLGKVILKKELNDLQTKTARELLQKEGFDLLDDTKTKLVEEIKNIIIKLVHYGELDAMNENLSAYLAGHLYKDYNYLSSLFSSVENNTIEQFFILQKIEKI